MTMIPEYGVTLQLNDEDFKTLIAKAIARDLIQASKYGYETTLCVTDISCDYSWGGWDIDYEIHAEEKVT